MPATSRSSAARPGRWSRGGSPKGATRVVHDCNPFAGDKCNTIRLVDQQHDPLLLRAGDRDQHRLDRCGERGVVQGRVRCGLKPARRRDGPRPNGKHDARRRRNVKNAALSILGFYNSQQQWVGVVVAPVRTERANKCNVEQAPPDTIPAHLQVYPTDWQVGGPGSSHGLHERRRDAEHGRARSSEDQLPRAIAHRDSHGRTGRTRRTPGTTRTSVIRWTPLARCSPHRAAPPSPT